jgi:transcription elongation factor Elf1
MNCPRCNATFFTSPVVSRKDDHTKICSYCSLMEDLEASSMIAPYHGRQYWTVDHPTDEETANR